MPFLFLGGGGGWARGEERGVSSRGVGPDVGPKSEKKKLEATRQQKARKQKTKQKRSAFSC